MDGHVLGRSDSEQPRAAAAMHCSPVQQIPTQPVAVCGGATGGRPRWALTAGTSLKYWKQFQAWLT